jgi:chorismate mutase-like protein
MMDIADWRQRIDELDAKLVELLNERASCALEIGRLKEETDVVVYDPKREAIVLESVVERNQGPLSDEALCGLFRQIISESRGLEEARTGCNDNGVGTDADADA